VDTAEARASFEEFVAARSVSLGRVAYLLTGHRHDAEDLLQTALIKVAMRWSRVDEPEAYVRRVLYTQAVSRWRGRGRRPEVLTDQPLVEGGREPDWETRVVLDQALRRLTPKQRAVLVLRFYEDMSESQTAAVLECSVGTPKGR
jgi:RNA polymerase sigma-70 factor (sigma-E family)